MGITIISSKTKERLCGEKNELEKLVEICINACKVPNESQNWCKLQIVDLYTNNPIEAEKLINNKNYKKSYVQKLSSLYEGGEKEIVMSVSLHVFESLSIAIRNTPSYRKSLEKKIYEIDYRVREIEQKSCEKNTLDSIRLNKSATTAEINDIGFLLSNDKKKVCLEIVLANRTHNLVCINSCTINATIAVGGAGLHPFSHELSYSVETPYLYITKQDSLIFEGKLFESDNDAFYKECEGIYEYRNRSGSRSWSVSIKLPVKFTIASGCVLCVRFYFAKPQLKIIVEKKRGNIISFCSFGKLLDKTVIVLNDTDEHTIEFSKDNIADAFLEFVSN